MCIYIINNEDTTDIVLVEVKLYAEYQQGQGFMLRIWVSQGFGVWGFVYRAPKKHISKTKVRDIPYKPPCHEAQ